MKYPTKVRVINGPADGIPVGAVAVLRERPTYDRAWPVMDYREGNVVLYFNLKAGNLIGSSGNYNLPYPVVILDIDRSNGGFRAMTSPPGESAHIRDRELLLGNTTGEDGRFVAMALTVYPYKLVYSTTPYLVNGVPEITQLNIDNVSAGHFIKVDEYDLLVVSRRASTTTHEAI